MDGTNGTSRKTITVVFCDMVGSTALSERLDAEALRHLLLRYYALLRECLERHGGTVEKFIGDAVMAVFGIPVVHEDDALRAARAALEILEAVEGFAAGTERDVGTGVAVRIGVHTGEVVTSGPVDAGHTLVSGEPVNVAARLEQHAAAGQILIGSATHRLIAAHAGTEPVEPLTVKGKSEPVPAWRLTGIRPVEEEPWRGPEGPLVDRGDELAQMRMVFARAVRDHTCHLLTLYGDPGVGKSRLARTFAEEAAEDGALVAATHCPPYGSVSSLAPLAGLLRQMLGDDPRERLAALLGTGVAERSAASTLLELVRTGVSPAPFEETRWALHRLCAVLGAERPLVVLLDDLHWAHEDLLGVLDHLADWTQGSAVLLLCAARLDLLERHAQWGSGKLSATALVVPPLAPDDCRELVLRLSGRLPEPGPGPGPGPGEGVEVVPHDTGGEAVPNGFVDQLVGRSEGNPLFCEQLVEMAVEGADPCAVPPSVRAVVAARLDRLAVRERRVLECGAVIGSEFGAEDLSTLLPAPPDAASRPQDVVRVLARRRLIEVGRAGAERWRFTSQLIRDEVYQGMSKLLRARQHERRAAHLAERTPDDHHAIGTHLERACRLRRELGPLDDEARATRARAVEHLAAAGTGALGRGDVRWAVDVLRRTLALLESEPQDATSLAVRTALAEARLASGEAGEAVTELRRILSEARVSGEARIEARVRLQLAYLEPGETGFAATLEAARAAVPVFTEADDALGLARAWLAMGQERQSRSLHGEATRYLVRAQEEAVRAGAHLERASILGALAVSLWLGPEPAPEALLRCGRIRAELADRRMARATVSSSTAVLLAMRGEHAEAGELLAEAAATLTDLGHLFALPAVHLFQAAVEELADHWEEAELLLRGAVADLTELGDGQLLETATRGLARLLITRPQDDEDDEGDMDTGPETVARIAPEAAAEALRLVDGLPEARLRAMPAAFADVGGIRARLAAAGGDASAAARHLAAALDAASATDSPVAVAGVELDRALAAAALGDPVAMTGAASAARRHFAAKGHLVGVRRAAALLPEGDR
ncbi:AAA family ATPase [Streptomyces albiaxialis]|uniref:AAA family ATPase n=1 Tax=Streptomyces albiaxialis TaxID=329523 RepID=A0ABN2WC75_9ACTN